MLTWTVVALFLAAAALIVLTILDRGPQSGSPPTATITTADHTPPPGVDGSNQPWR